MYVAEFFNPYWNDAQPMKKPQSFTKYLRQTLIFMSNSALRGKFNFCFSGYFYYDWQKFDSGGGRELGSNSMKFWDFPDISFFVWTLFFVFYIYMKYNIIKI